MAIWDLWLAVPSGTETGIKIPLGNLEVEEGSYVTLTLDFVVEESFVVLGDVSTPAGVEGFNFTPVVMLESVELAAAATEEGSG